MGMTEARKRLERLSRILKVRQIAVDEAEGRTRECEFRIRGFEERRDSEESRIRQTMEEFSHADGQTGLGLQRWEQVIQTGRNCLTRIRQDIEETRAKRDEHRAQWREALREYKTVEKLRERQLQEVSQNERILMQKMTDEASISSHWRKTGNDPESQ